MESPADFSPGLVVVIVGLPLGSKLCQRIQHLAGFLDEDIDQLGVNQVIIVGSRLVLYYWFWLRFRLRLRFRFCWFRQRLRRFTSGIGLCGQLFWCCR